MRTIIKLLVLISFLLTLETVNAQKTWMGTTSTAWNTSANWSPAGVPASTDDVIIPSAPANQPVVSGTSTPVCKNLTINSGASLSISATATNNALLTASGNVTINGALSIGGAIGKTGKLIAVNVTWSSTASMSGFLGGRMEVSGNWEFSTGSAIQMGLCGVTFTGNVSKEILSKSSTSSFSNVTLDKTGGAILTIGFLSTSTLRFGGSVTINAGNTLDGNANITTIFSNNLNNSGHFTLSNGTASFEKTSGIQVIEVNSGDFFYKLNINAGGTVTINNPLTVKNDLIIQAGVFDPQNNTLNVKGDWVNAVGPDAFVEGTGRVIFSGGTFDQYCTTETFNILEVNTAPMSFRVNGATVTCEQYDWTAGPIHVASDGTFTALDLADNGIRGSFVAAGGGTINLYQDASQSVDLGGNLDLTGGNINIYGGSGLSIWPNLANASLFMTGGTLDFKDQGISVNSGGAYTLSITIGNGTIRTPGNFSNNRTDFNPIGGTLELYGSSYSLLDLSNGNLWNLKINKPSSFVSLNSNLTISNYLEINTGSFTCWDRTLNILGDVSIFNNGVLRLRDDTQLSLANGSYLKVYSGGELETSTEPPDIVTITSSSGYYFIQVQSGGTISSRNTVFQKMNTISMQSGSMVDPANSFYNCTFTNNSAAYASMLIFSNSQDITINRAEFPQLNSSYTVFKSNNAGKVTFKDATGAFAGTTYENDPFNRIFWVASTPGLWKGTVSSSWSQDANWDNHATPSTGTAVTIPAGTPFSPVIGSTGHCSDLSIEEGTILTVEDDATLYCAGHFYADQGQFIMQGSSFLRFVGGLSSLWLTQPDNIYSNVIINKATLGFTKITFSTDVTCTGYMYIYEGILQCQANLMIESLSDNAFFVNDDGGVELDPSMQISVAGNVQLDTGTEINTEGDFYIGKNFFADEGVTGIMAKLIVSGSGDQYFNNQSQDLIIDHFKIDKPSGICYLESDLKTSVVEIDNGALSCNSGSSLKNSFDVYTESWFNNIGTDGFHPGTGKVQFFVGQGNQPVCWGNTDFNLLEVNNPSHVNIYDLVTCATYDWTQGGIWISGNGNFYAADLADNGIYGNWILENNTIELHQDAGQSVDLIGNLTISGGEFKVYGENLDWSRWGSVGNTMLTMTGGTLEFGVNNGIYISDFAPYAFTSNITGGTIRTRDFYSLSPGFDPSGGTVEKSGEGYGEVQAYNGSYFHNLKINASEYSTRIYSCDIINDLTIEGHTVFSGGNSLQCGNVIINNGGTLRVDCGNLKMKNNGTININSGGYFYFTGSKVTGINPADRYSFDANSGSWMSASNTEFENMDQDGIYIHPGALVKLSPAFQNCVFSNGAAGGTLLNINNNQDLFIENAVFPANTWWGQYNVMKNINAGQVFFSNATGAFSGAAYESDPFNRIFWAGQPDEQTVILPEGWSGLSTWLLPLPEDDVADLLAPILSDFTILLNNTGGMYYPASGINTIGKWASQSAFKVKMENEASLTLEGGWELNKTFEMMVGWNLMPVIFNDVWDAPLAAQQLGAKLVIIKEVAGTKVYWPQYGIQTLYWLQPGNAYYVKLNSAGSLTFPPNDVKGTSAVALEKYNPQSPWGIVNATGTSHIIAVPASLLAAFAVGDVIGVFTTEGVCVGFEEIRNPAESMAITAWGDDPTTLHKDGFEIGEKMTLRLCKRMTKATGHLDVTWDTQLPDEGFFVTDGISALKEMKLVSTGIVQENSGIYVYPNPTDGIIKICSPEEIKEIVLTNPEGAVIMHLNAGSSVDVEADLTTLPSGIYQIRIITDAGVVVRKVIRK